VSALERLVPDLKSGRASARTARVQDETQASYRSRQDFAAIRKIAPQDTHSAQDWVNLLRGLSFQPEAPNAQLQNGSDAPIGLHLSLKTGSDSA